MTCEVIDHWVEPTHDGAMENPSTVIANYADAWQTGDIDRVFASYAPDIVLHYGGTSRFAGAHVGKERVIDVLVETAIVGERRLVAVDELFEQESTGALFVRESMLVDGVSVELDRALRFRIHGGLIVECWLYDHDQHLVDRAWSRPAPAD